MSRESFDNTGPGDHLARSSPASKPFYEIGRSDHALITRLFKRSLTRLGRYYTIEKASLALFDNERDCLHVTHLLNKGVFKSGLTLTIPNRHSLLYQVLMQGFPIVDNYPELISRNIIEKKILLGPATRSVVVIPLMNDGIPGGILNLASEDDSAFSLYLEGRGEAVVAEFISELGHILMIPAGIT